MKRLNRVLVTLETYAAGGLVITVCAVVLLQVLMRYLVAQPNPWSEEVSRFAFIWVSLLGASLAVEHRAHFGFDQVTQKLAPRAQRAVETFAGGVVLVFALVLIGTGIALMHLTMGERSAALNLPIALVYAAVPVSGVLMVIHLLAGRNEDSSAKGHSSAQGDSSAEGDLRRGDRLMGGLLLGVFGALVLAAVPIGFALATAAAIAIVAADLPLVIIPQQIVAGMDSFPMLAVPLFILAGFLMDVGGISRRLVTLARSLVGHLPGGLGQVVILAEIFFSGVSGSTSADAAAIGGIMVPQLTANGYSRERSTAIVSAACGMGILIPPAIVMVVYGVIGNVSIGALFVASIAPALLIAVGLMTQIGWQARREGWPAEPRASFADVRHAGFDALLPLFMIVVILGGIRFGLFTPTEAAAVAVAYALLLAGPVYRSLSASDLWSKVVQTAMVSGMVLFVVGAARLLGWVLAVMEVPQTLASSVVGMGGGQAGFLILTILVFLPLGAILEGVPAVVLLTPILLPLARQLGIDPVHYGAVIVATQGISVFLPPVGVSLLVACSVGGVKPAEVARPLWPYLALMLALTLVIAFLPGVVLFLPNLLGY